MAFDLVSVLRAQAERATATLTVEDALHNNSNPPSSTMYFSRTDLLRGCTRGNREYRLPCIRGQPPISCEFLGQSYLTSKGNNHTREKPRCEVVFRSFGKGTHVLSRLTAKSDYQMLSSR